ncbi:MAG: hemolysin family protein [Acidimicrobiales bacterium]
MSGWPAFALSFVLLAVNGFFVALEFSMVGSRRTKLEEAAADGTRVDRLALESTSDLTLQLAGAQLGITVASLGLGIVAEPAMEHLLEPVAHFLHLPSGLAVTVSAVVGLSIVVFLHLVIGELVPKNLAMADPERTLRWLVLPNRAYLVVFRPAVKALNLLGNVGARAFGVQPRDELGNVPTAEELTVMLTASRDEGLIEDFAHELLTGVLDFGERAVTTVMVPRTEICSITPSTTLRQAESLVIESGHSRLLLQGADGLDDVRGFVHAKDLLTIDPELADRPVPLRLVRRMLVVPVDRTLEDLLLSMRRARVHVAVVTDADGRTAGLVTLEDLLEELVGDILDETD